MKSLKGTFTVESLIRNIEEVQIYIGFLYILILNFTMVIGLISLAASIAFFMHLATVPETAKDILKEE